MSPNYTIEHHSVTRPAVLYCNNFHGLNMVGFYGYHYNLIGPSESCVAIFKIRYK
jgi:hypothetical protein